MNGYQSRPLPQGKDSGIQNPAYRPPVFLMFVLRSISCSSIRSDKHLNWKASACIRGLPSKLKFKPLPENSGISFLRCDLPSQPEIPALWSNVVDTRNCTCLGDGDKNIVGTIEHLMSALYVRGIDNLLVEVSNPELPIMDGSAAMLYDALMNIPLKEQNAPRRYLKVKRKFPSVTTKATSVTF